MKPMLAIAVIVSTVFLLFLYGVGEEVPETMPVVSTAPQHAESLTGICAGPVLETMSSGGYTYVNVDCGDRQLWAAGPETLVAVGDDVSLPPGQEMRDFESPTLGRTFDSILFVPSIRPAGDAGATGGVSLAEVHGRGGGPTEQTDVDLSGIDKPAGAHSIAEVFANRTELEGREVVVVGKVVKYNAMIMGKNWIHVQDGTGEPGSNDLTLTTLGTASVGDTLLVQGKVSLSKDVGAGYQYEILIEDATITVQ